ncbi:MAG: glycosyltransferase family 4 protein, partial [Anaerolineae bacterium]|nr:glycosyltransferase family 4 protein [Anaerolineae bacterium]
LAKALATQHELCALTAFVHGDPVEGEVPIRHVRTNKLFLSLDLARTLRAFGPDLIIYVPTACATAFSFFRARMLKRHARGVPVVMLALQWRRYGALARLAMPHLRPDLVLVQSERTQASLEFSGACVAPLPPSVDLERFAPVDAALKWTLRQRHGLEQGAYVILHVGHLNRGRNVQALLALQRDARLQGIQTLVVGSSSTEHDVGLVSELARGGVRVIDRYVSNIAEVYALADCYLFPVGAKMSAIDLPLSVLEAMACNLPVITTRFGGLEDLFRTSSGLSETALMKPGLFYADTLDEMVAAIGACRQLQAVRTRTLVAPYDKTSLAERVLRVIADELGLKRVCAHEPVETARREVREAALNSSHVDMEAKVP